MESDEPRADNDVLVLGGGLVGLWLARSLARAGARVSVLERGPELGRFALRAGGLLGPGLGEHLSRSLESLGPEGLGALLGLTAASRQRLATEAAVRLTGGLHLCGMPGEEREVEACLRELPALGVGIGPVDAAEVPGWAGGPGYRLRDEGRVEPRGALERLVRSAREAGARLCTRQDRQALEGGPGGLRLWLPDGPLRAELVVHTDLDPIPGVPGLIGEALVPVRHQWRAGARPPAGLGEAPVYSQHEHLHWFVEEGHLVAGGARYVEVEMEAGQTDDERVNPRIDEALRDRAARFFSSAPPAAEAWRWAAIALHSCDGLPLAGPVPGVPRHLLLSGLHAQEWSLGPALAEALAAELLGEASARLPDLLRPVRLL